MILAKHTSSLLSQPSSHQGWCSLLFHLLKHVIGSECEEELVSGVIVALKNNPLLLNAEGPNSLSLLIKYLLTPGSDYEVCKYFDYYKNSSFIRSFSLMEIKKSCDMYVIMFSCFSWKLRGGYPS